MKSPPDRYRGWRSGHTIFALAMGSLLVLRGLAGFLAHPNQLFGLSTTMDHNMLHIIAGGCYLWVGAYATRSCTRGWNKFLGWFYAVIAAMGIMKIRWLMHLLGANTTADDIFNLFVAASSLVAGYYGSRLKHKSFNFLAECGWKLGK